MIFGTEIFAWLRQQREGVQEALDSEDLKAEEIFFLSENQKKRDVLILRYVLVAWLLCFLIDNATTSLHSSHDFVV